MKHISFVTIGAMVIGLLTIADAGAAQTPAGLWSSTLYRVELQVSGGTVSGTFTLLDDLQAPPGRIAGQINPDGRSFTAEWTFTVGRDTGTFNTWLNFADRDGLLTGYRWTEDTLPTVFALHRAVDGQLVEVFGEENVDDGTAVSTPIPTPGGAVGGATPGAPAPQSDIQVIVCESVADGEPINISDQFTAPRSITALVKYRNLPQNSTIDWLWSMDGRTEAKLNKTLGGNGWYMHGLRSETAIIPGAYELIVAVNGRLVAQRTVTVRPPAGKPAGAPPPATGGATNGDPNIDVTICQSAPDGKPVNPGTEFTKPRSLACLVTYRNLPENSELKWVWQLPSGSTRESTRAVKGTGWAWHGLNADPAMSPGTYSVTVLANGRTVKTVPILVR